MPSRPDPGHEQAGPHDTAVTRLQSLPSRTYGLRVLGMGLAAIPQVVVMRELGGFDVIRGVRNAGNTIPIMMITGHGSEQAAGEAIRHLPKRAA